MQPRAGFGGGTGQPEGVVQRVQVARVAIDLSAFIDLGADQVLNTLTVERFQMAVVVVTLKFFGVCMAISYLRIGPAGMGDAGMKVTGML